MVATLEQVFREEWGRLLATLIGIVGDFGLAEEAAACQISPSLLGRSRPSGSC